MTAEERCADCGRAMRLRPGRQVCSACYARSTRVECSRCGALQPPNARDGEGRPLCQTCVRRQRAAAELAVMRQRITSVVAEAEPSLNHVTVDAVVAASAHNLRSAKSIHDAVAAGPAPLLGSSTAPVEVDRLVVALQAVGGVRVVHPSCFGCGTTRWLTQRVNGLRACNWCAIKARPEECSQCGKDVPVSTRNADGRAICYRCHGADPMTFQVCIGCGRPRRVAHRTPEGPRCSDCGRRRAVVYCSVCGEVRVSTSGLGKGRPKCTSCVKRRATCSSCGKGECMIAMVFATGPVCSTCHKTAQEAKGTCRGCGQCRRIDPRDPDQRGLCSDCAGLEPWSVCTSCRVEDRIYDAGRCIACTLEHRLRELLGSSSAMLDPLLQCLTGTDRPRAALRWLAKPEPKHVLGAMARGEMASSHEALDDRPSTPAREHIRHVLVAAGVLPERDEEATRLEAWVHEQLAAVEPEDDRKVLDAFARWWVLQRYRRRIERVGRSSSSHPRRLISGAVDFMGWLRAHDVTLGQCTQAHVELWLAGPPGRVHARDFIRWACRRHLAQGIDIVRRPDSTPGRSGDTDHLLATARLFAVNDALPLVDRVAGLLLLCYGQTFARMVRLRHDDIVVGVGGTSIRLGATEVILTGPVGRLVEELLSHPQGRASTAAPQRAPWLFPGARPGRAMTPDALGTRLASYGIDARQARTTVLLDLAAELAPAFLADLLGMHVGTAVRWSRIAGGDWAGYAAARARG